MCGMVNRPSAQSCECGFHFDDTAEMRDFLRGRVATGWVMVVGGLLLTIGSVVLVLFVHWIGAFAIIGSVGMFTKGTRIIDAARSGLRDLPEVPAARLLSR